MYTIKDFAELFDVSEHTIRYYTDINLLPCKRDDRNRRIFDEESINWMHGITCLKGCGASLEDIEEYCRLCHMEESEENLQLRYKIFLKQQVNAKKKLEEAKKVVNFMSEKIQHYEDILLGNTIDNTNPKKWDNQNRPIIHK